MNLVRVALITFAAVVSSSSVQSEPLKFNGAQFQQIESAPSAVSFRSKDTSKFIETVSIRSIESHGNFDEISRHFIAQAKTESEGAKLLVMEKPKARQLMVAYLKVLDRNKMLYKVELLSAPNGVAPVSVAYSSESERGDTGEISDSKVKSTAIEALARFDMNKARNLLRPAK